MVRVFLENKFLKWSSLHPQKRGSILREQKLAAESGSLGVDIDLDPKASKH